jgi:glycosyltransferase involved in cell wall biosynthesis
MSAPITLDISRLLWRAARRVPTGIDRVEHAYAEVLQRLVPERLRYAAVHPLGHFRSLPTGRARHFIERIGQEWSDAMPVGEPETVIRGSVNALARQLQALMLLPGRAPAVPRQGRPAYLLVSHHHLHQAPAIRAAQERLRASFVCFIHDLIPIEYPEYGSPGQDVRHRQRIETAVRMADAFVVNSASTRDSLLPYLHGAGRDVPLLVAPLGVRSIGAAGTAAPADPPYFVYVGTIEPRKNHLLLLHIWRHLVERMGDATPRLVLVGQRGWENEMVVDILDRSVTLRGHVVEHNALPDTQVQALIAGSRAVLLPSFAEGYGLPLAEALALGVPVLCSDLPALREVGGDAPDYLDPIDGMGWMAAILDYLDLDSPRRAAQLRRIGGWSPPEWAPHLEAVLALIDGLRAG